jgi:hypothetical protein
MTVENNWHIHYIGGEKIHLKRKPTTKKETEKSCTLHAPDGSKYVWITGEGYKQIEW